ncbi:MAG: hypothetical protein GX957_15605 [Clostridiaceae bacterium]|nr:hypothetical protein [Clostridiaceae bacterium]
MEYLFSSGEILHKNNRKTLAEGIFEGEKIAYDQNIQPDDYFSCTGTLNGKKAIIKFMICESEFEYIKMRMEYRVLMQSDILQSKWKDYNISFID